MTGESEARIISGGQSGIDRLALDIAMELQVVHGGWCPAGRRSEWGPIPDKYKLRETKSKNYAVRTKQNIVDADGTLVLHHGPATGGTALTIRVAQQQGRPVFCVDFEVLSSAKDLDDEVVAIGQWLADGQIKVLNVAGPRATSHPALPGLARPFLEQVIVRFREFVAGNQQGSESHGKRNQ